MPRFCVDNGIFILTPQSIQNPTLKKKKKSKPKQIHLETHLKTGNWAGGCMQ